MHKHFLLRVFFLQLWALAAEGDLQFVGKYLKRRSV